jgi:hypothetical protein
MMINIARRASNGSRRNSNETGGAESGLGYGELSSDESSWPSDASDKESLQSWKHKHDTEDDEEMERAAKEEEGVRRWFLVVTALMVLAGTGITVYTFFYLKGQEEDEFVRTVSEKGTTRMMEFLFSDTIQPPYYYHRLDRAILMLFLSFCSLKNNQHSTYLILVFIF